MAEERVLITEDRDFGTLTMRFARPAVGVVIAHIQDYPHGLDEIVDRISDSIHNLGDKLLGFLTTIEPGRVRQRPLPEIRT